MPRLRDLVTLGLTASAAPAHNEGTYKPSGALSRDHWQERAWRYNDEVGEIGYASNFYARPMSRVLTFPECEIAPNVWVDVDQLDKMRAGTSDPPEGVTVEELPSDVELAVVRAAWDDFQDRGGGREDMQSQHGKLSFLNGEMYLAKFYDDDDDQSYWGVKSRFELRPKRGDDGKWEVWPGPKASTQDLLELSEPADGKDVASGQVKPYRLWTPHGQYSQQADAPMRQVIERAEELILASRSVKSTLRSRVPKAGILYANSKLFPGPPPPEDEPHPFLETLGKHLMEPLRGDGDASEIVPILVTGSIPKEERAFERITFAEREGYPELPLIEALMRRIATSLDMPLETLLGFGDVNHWTGWLVKDEQWSHIDPVMRRFCSDVTSIYLRPVLRAGAVVEWRRWRVGYDPSPAIVKPDRGKDADAAHDRGAINDKAYRIARGFTDDDAVADRPGDGTTNPRVLAALAGNNPDGQAASTPNDGAPQQGVTIREVQAAADVALHRCRELAGGRIKSYLHGSAPFLHQEIRDAGVANADIAAHLGVAKVKRHMNGSGNAATLVQGGSKCFADALRGRVPDEKVNVLREVIEVYAAQTLFQREPGRVPV